jgi:cutinase
LCTVSAHILKWCLTLLNGNGIVTKLPTALKSKVIAAAVFGDPYRTLNQPFPVDDASADVIKFCNLGDPVCQNGANVIAHLAYATDGSVTKASTFIASKFA